MKNLTIVIITILTLLILFISYVTKNLLPFKPFLPYLNYLIGVEKPTSYIVLLQNDNEIRANGGFAGSYATVTINTSSLREGTPTWQSHFLPEIHYLNPQITLDFQDIYVPNGQLKGYVTPPQPIQDAFQHGTWNLANSDWEPDFPTASTTIRWFFEKGGVKNPDILATLSLSTIKKILSIVGPYKVSEYNAEITPENFYLFLQGQAENNFFPGSTQKKDALASVGKALKNKLMHLSLPQYIKIAQTIKQDINNQNILINSTNKDFQQFLDSQGYSGHLTKDSLDSYMLVETNLGANKANCCVIRKTTHTITKETNSYNHQVDLSITNQSPEANPNPPFSYSGHYVAYLRFLIPTDAYDITVTPKESSPSGGLKGVFDKKINITENLGFKQIGFFQITAAGTTSTVDLSYNTATGSALFPYQLTIQKQHGMVSSPSIIFYDGQKVSTDLNKDFFFDSKK